MPSLWISDPWGTFGSPFNSLAMIYTIYLILFLVAVVAITYPEEFPTLVRNPDQLLAALGLETKRRWMILKFGTILFVERQRLRHSLWRARPIIKAERLKQKQQEETKLD